MQAHWHPNRRRDSPCLSTVGMLLPVALCVATGLGLAPPCDGTEPQAANQPASKELRVRVTINGFSVERETEDDKRQTDGKGDEVYIEARVGLRGTDNRELPLPKEVVVVRKSKLMGDTNRAPGRIRAGSRSSEGGLKTGDRFPDAEPWKRKRAPQGDELPMAIFEGKLRQGEDAVVIIPSIIEWDNAPDYLLGFADGVAKVASEVLPFFAGKPNEKANFVKVAEQRAKAAISPTTALVLAQAIPVVWKELRSLFGTAGDRPIGLQETKEGKLEYKPPVICLTYESAKRLGEVDFGRGRGVLELHYRDAKSLGSGHYVLFLQIELLK